MRRLGIPCFCGTNSYPSSIVVNEGNYLSILQSDECASNINTDDAYFQTNEVTVRIYDYLRRESVKTSICSINPFSSRYDANNDLFIHIRLTDVARFNPGLGFYSSVLASIPFDNLYIASDDLDHEIPQTLLKSNPGAQLVTYDDVRTIQFGSTCRHVIVSHGSFSAVIGYLSFYSTVHYPDYGTSKRGTHADMGIWFGDMFSIPGWKMGSIPGKGVE
jgi:hypothetical protein